MAQASAQLLCLFVLLGACTKQPGVSDAGRPPVSVIITASAVSTRFVTREHLLASAEMQISGEPLAEAMGRDLSLYSRDNLTPDVYFDTSLLSPGPWVDLPGFSSGIESYEYSKQAMNNLAFESAAGTSLVYGPLINSDGGVGLSATANLAERVQHFAVASNALGRFVFPPNTFPVGNPSGTINPFGAGTGDQNPLGWPGIWPTVHVFRSFDPTIDPTPDAKLWCSISSDDDPGATGAAGCADYECSATTLHLRNRAQQLDDRIITPGADGFSGWKYALWVINYLQAMHDSTEATVSAVSEAELGGVGTGGNTIVGADDTGAPTAPGTFLGSSDIEGFQASLFIEELDNRAEDWLSHLSTEDGTTLSGFPNLKEALAYGLQSPLRWFPSAIRVTETDDQSGFPHPHYALASADSALLDQLGLTLSYATLYALTDRNNPGVGGTQTARDTFDGDPFASDNQLADGDPTPHDRSLAMLRVVLVNLDRLHSDPSTGTLIDDVKIRGTSIERGTTASTSSVAYAVIALRTALRSLSSQLQLYSNNTPDTAISSTVLDGLPLHAVGHEEITLSQRVKTILRAQSELLLTQLTDPSGRAFPGWDLARGTVTDDADLLDSHTAAVRGLLASYLATGDVRYRDRAMAVFNRLERTFYDSEARLYTVTPAPSDSVTYTPLRFALLQSTLRDVYELIASRPGNEGLALQLETRIGRLNKLVLNGWDDRNQNRAVDWPSECINVQDDLPRGGLQMAERTLTGEIGATGESAIPIRRMPTSDRERDCVPEIDDAHLPAALAESITLQISRSR
jgi:hypothetical protein